MSAPACSDAVKRALSCLGAGNLPLGTELETRVRSWAESRSKHVPATWPELVAFLEAELPGFLVQILLALCASATFFVAGKTNDACALIKHAEELALSSSESIRGWAMPLYQNPEILPTRRIYEATGLFDALTNKFFDFARSEMTIRRIEDIIEGIYDLFAVFAEERKRE
jgi:hypothetical protein